MPVPWKGLEDIGTPFLSYESKILEEYHSNIEDMIGPILNDLRGENNYHVSSRGFIENKSGSIAQQWLHSPTMASFASFILYFV